MPPRVPAASPPGSRLPPGSKMPPPPVRPSLNPGENITKVIVASGLSTVHTSFLRKYMYSQDSSSISSIFCKPEGVSSVQSETTRLPGPPQWRILSGSGWVFI
ncbi:uncharacterized protein LOC8055838 isoform X2 [Sorghum bicolor]|uniref:uncharacterized protein LOC8055838 isoform X2 n=1 Tax=Sorghum bicolor TaxID=4558 RepID=UPI000B426A4D|nr:uncharacterized protein LOC8055838 isoform X2 [Sorghum bicolor]|eukprot:XP_021308505.1 uncharacterized protein LOC8055838 isoform X2 [Sorghum bicolor]